MPVLAAGPKQAPVTELLPSDDSITLSGRVESWVSPTCTIGLAIDPALSPPGTFQALVHPTRSLLNWVSLVGTPLSLAYVPSKAVTLLPLKLTVVVVTPPFSAALPFTLRLANVALLPEL